MKRNICLSTILALSIGIHACGSSQSVTKSDDSAASAVSGDGVAGGSSGLRLLLGWRRQKEVSHQQVLSNSCGGFVERVGVKCREDFQPRFVFIG